jgi:hypothetical protein
MNKQVRKGRVTPSPTKPGAKRPYQRPVLTKLGSLKDMTMSTSGGVTSDGPGPKHTGRGGRNGVDGR